MCITVRLFVLASRELPMCITVRLFVLASIELPMCITVRLPRRHPTHLLLLHGERGECGARLGAEERERQLRVVGEQLDLNAACQLLPRPVLIPKATWFGI
jgi:hypothetical protein